jgi:LacI family transcriptional regulator
LLLVSADAELPPVLGRVTITDVARVAGVSVATVSKVMNGRDGVAAATFERVMSVVNELGYETSLIASSLRRRQTNVLGVLVADFEPYSTEVLKGISEGTHGTGYQLLAYSGWAEMEPDFGWERRSLSRLAGTLIDGAILVTPTTVMSGVSIPIVAIDPHQGHGDTPTVDSDSFAGARLATDHLIGLGHRRIAHIRGRADLESTIWRERGYCASLEAAGIPFDPSLVLTGEYRRPDGYAAARELLTRPEPPTAIFAANDLSALGAIDAARELGLQVPHDLSIVGFDDIPEASSTTPRLTTVAQPLHEMGRRAVQLLIEELTTGTHAHRRIHLDARLTIRDTTAPPRAR